MHRNIPVVQQLMNAIKERGCPQFASFTYEAQPSGARLTVERARHVILLGADMEELYKRDIAALEHMERVVEIGVRLEAVQALLATRRKSLTLGFGNNPNDTQSHAYMQLDCPGLKLHLDTGNFHIMGLTVTKVVLQAATYRTVNSKPLTIAKKEIEKQLPSGRLRQFNLGNRTTVKIDGQTLEFGD